MKMRVLVLSTLYPSAANPISGIFVHHQVKALVSQGIDVRVIAPVPFVPFPLSLMKRRWRTYSQIPDHAVMDGIEVAYPKFPLYPRSWFYATSGKRLWRAVQGVVERAHRSFPFDVVHAHVALPAGHAALHLAKAYGKPLVVTLHGQDLQTTVNIDPDCESVIGEVLRGASSVVFVSQKLHRLAIGRFGDQPQWSVIPNGVDLTRVQLPTELTQPFPTVLSVSNLVDSKGIDLNIRAIKQVLPKYPNLQYLVVGDGPTYPDLVRLTKELRLETNVTFLGQRTHDEVMGLMANCDVFALPSWREGFGVVYLEALVHAKPVIATLGEGAEDFVVDGLHGRLVVPRSVDDLVRAMDDLLGDSDRARMMGERGRQMVLEQYTWERNAVNTVRLYQSILDN